MIHCFHDYIYIYITRIWLLWDLRVAIYYITLHVEHSLVPLYQQVYTVIVFLSNTSDRWLLKHKLNCAYDFPTYCNLYKTHSMRLKKHLLLHLRLWKTLTLSGSGFFDQPLPQGKWRVGRIILFCLKFDLLELESWIVICI